MKKTGNKFTLLFEISSENVRTGSFFGKLVIPKFEQLTLAE